MFKLILKSLGSTLAKSVFGALLGVFRGGLSMALNAFKNTLNAAFTSVKSFNQMGVNTSRAIGLGYRDSIAYTQTLITRTQRLSALYGVTADKIAAIQDSLAKVTGKAIMLSNAQAEYATAINKMLGDGVLDEYSKAIIRSMGGSVDAAQKYAIGAYAKATRVGLSAAEFSNKVAQNLSMANRVSFRGGIDGITKMTALSEKLNFNLQSMEASANVFRDDIQTAIESSAKLQALGGGAAMYGSNPLAMMYESMYDMESYTERITKMVKGMAEFNAATGIAEIKSQNQAFLREYSKILNISYDELASMATNQAKEAFAKNRLGAAFFDNIAGGDEDFKSYIMNKAQWNDKEGRFELTLPGQENNPINLQNMSPENIEALRKAWKDSTLTETEAFLQGARDITSVDERISGIMSVVGAMLAEKLMPYLEVASMWLSKAAPKIASVVGKGLQMLLTPGFWKNIGLDFASILIGGLAGLLQIYILTKHPVLTLIGIVSAIADAIGNIFDIDWLKGLGKTFDGRGAAEWAANFARSMMAGWKDPNAAKAQDEFLTEAGGLLEQASKVLGIGTNYANAVEKGEQYDYIGALQSVTGENYRGSGSYGFAQTEARAQGTVAYNTTNRNATVNNNRYTTNTTNNSTQTVNRNTTNTTAATNYQAVQRDNDTHNYQLSALRVFEDIRKNTRDSSNALGDIQDDNRQMAQAQIDATEEIMANPAYAVQQNGGEVVNGQTSLLNTPEIQMASLGGGGGLFNLASTALGLYLPYKMFKSGMKSMLGRGATNTASQGGYISRGFGKARAFNQFRAQNYNYLRNNGVSRFNAFTRSLKSPKVLSNGAIQNQVTGKIMGNIASNSAKSTIARNIVSGGKIFKAGAGVGLGIAGSIGNSLVDEFVKPEDYGGLTHYAGRGVSTALEGAGIGMAIGSFVPVIGNVVGGIAGGIIGGIVGLFNASSEAKAEEERKKEAAKLYEEKKRQIHNYLGQYGTGFETAAFNPTTFQDSVVGSMSAPMAAALDSAVQGSDVVAAPVGQSEYIYSQPTTQVAQNAQQTIKVSDITVKVNGTLKLDAGNGNVAQLDMNKLLEDRAFVKKLVEVVFNEKNVQSNNGRSVFDTVSFRNGGVPLNGVTANIT